jgi:hypothetical protein
MRTDVPRDHRGHFRKATIPGRVKAAVVAALGAKPGTTTPVRCHYCGAAGEVWWPLTSTGKVGAHMVTTPLEFDHVIPEIAGGPTSPENLVLACRRCNRSKGWR